MNDENIEDLLATLTSMVTAIDAHKHAIDVILGCIENLDARSLVSNRAIQSLTTRIAKLENVIDE